MFAHPARMICTSQNSTKADNSCEIQSDDKSDATKCLFVSMHGGLKDSGFI